MEALYCRGNTAAQIFTAALTKHEEVLLLQRSSLAYRICIHFRRPEIGHYAQNSRNRGFYNGEGDTNTIRKKHGMNSVG